jgi:predicted nucleic acid-binding protein
MKLIFDTSVLSCFARAAHLDVLEAATRGHERLVPRAVRDEIKLGTVDHPRLAAVLELEWLKEVPVDSLGELAAFVRYARHLSAGERNIGEASVLAWAEVHGATAVLDDQDAVQCAKASGVKVACSLSIVSTGLKENRIDMGRAQSIVDDLIELGGARFPCDGAGFAAWARENGIL